MSDSTAMLTSGEQDIESLLGYWFEADSADSESLQSRNRRWFMSSAEQDRALEQRFGDLAHRAALGELDAWAATARGRLALVILLDQLPRNLHRATPAAFAQDRRALELCLEGLSSGHAAKLDPIERVFLCMPLQHAESREIQRLSVETFAALADAGSPEPLRAALRGFADYAVQHRDIVERFGRFPHRNKALGRHSTAAEIEFMKSGGPSFGQ